MNRLFGNNGKKQDLITEYTKICNDAELGYRDNIKLANQWGKVNITLGLFTAIASSLSAILTFSDNQFATRALAFISALCVVCMTSLNPASRETKRRSIATLFLIQWKRLQAEKVIYELSQSDSKIIELLRKASSEFQLALQEANEILGGVSNVRD